MKQFLKSILGQDTIDRIKHIRDIVRLRLIRVVNRITHVRYINLGAGSDADRIGWWAGDVQTGFVFNENTHLPLKPASIDFAFSSMFFEHLDNATAASLLSEVHRVLKPGKCLRIIVPDFGRYIQHYRAGDRNFFYSAKNQNFDTWAAKGVTLDMEHLLVSMISAIHNLPHEMVPYKFLEDFTATPARVHYPFQTRFGGYYCGPAPEITTEEIRERLNGPEADFLNWVFERTDSSAHQDPTFNSWHKNAWNLDKLRSYAVAAGFTRVERSSYMAFGPPVDAKLEKPQHEPLGAYFNLYNA
jgi:SAM-dependent methyltransferase